MVVAPEHPLLDQLVVSKREGRCHVLAAAKKSDLDRTDLAKESPASSRAATALIQ